MIWVVDEANNRSMQITGCNTFVKDDGTHQLWVERPSGKTLMLRESKDEIYIQDLKESIDWAIKLAETVYRL